MVYVPRAALLLVFLRAVALNAAPLFSIDGVVALPTTFTPKAAAVAPATEARPVVAPAAWRTDLLVDEGGGVVETGC